MTRAGPRTGLAAALALLLAGCSEQPSDEDIRGAVERLQQAWAQQQREAHQARNPSPLRLPDLSLEASLSLRILGLRRLSCREAPEVSGWLCTFEVTASNAGNPPVTRLMQGRFSQGYFGWVARDVQPAETPR
jgi:hypothetical protein